MTDERNLNCELQFEDFINPFAITEIISSKSYLDGTWKQKTELSDFRNGISKHVLPIDMSSFSIAVISEVVPGRRVALHKHDDEPQFRYVMSGDLTLNGVEYHSGDWVIVPIGIEYEVSTIAGYTTMAGYGMSCQCSGVGGH